MLLKRDFEEWLAGLCDFYSRSAWFTRENIDATWRDIRGVELDALEEVGSWIRKTYRRWTDGFSVSAVIHEGWKAVSVERARQKTKDAEQGKVQWTPPTPEQAARNQARCREILDMVRGQSKRPSWADLPRKQQPSGPDAYHRTRAEF